MAIRRLDTIIGVQDAYTQGLNKARGAFNAASGAMLTSVKIGAVAAAAALGALSVAAWKAVSAANEVDAIEKKLATALGYTSQALLDQASALQKVTTFGDDQIVGVQAMIAMFVKDEAQIKAATKATLDFAAAKGIDLATAGDLIAKTLGSSTNALGRYGIEVKGAVGSTERLDSVTKGLADVFGGQAVAAAETFSGKLTQMKNSYGDIWEELGFVITRNQFFVKGLDVVTGAFASLADKIKENRLWLMELTKSGVLSFVKGMGFAVEAVRFFHNGWLGLKLAAYSVAFAFGEVTNAIYKALRFILLPIDLMYQGLQALGLVEVNPFDAAQKAVNSYRETVLATGADTLTEIEKTNSAYDAVGRAIKGIETGLRNIQVAQVDIAAGAPVAARVIVDEEEEKRRKKEAEAAEKAREAARTQLAAMGEAPGGIAPEDEFSKAWLGYQAQLEALNQYNTQKLLLMQAVGFSEAEIAAANADMVIDQEAKKRDFQIAAAATTAGIVANTAQNLMTALGTKNKALFKIMKAAAIGEAIINTFQGATKALATVPYPFNFVAAASVVASGMAQVAKIKAQEPEGGGGAAISMGGSAAPSYSGGSATAYPVPTRVEEAKPTQAITLIIQNPLNGQIADSAAEAIIDLINRGGNMNYKINAQVVAS